MNSTSAHSTTCVYRNKYCVHSEYDMKSPVMYDSAACGVPELKQSPQVLINNTSVFKVNPSQQTSNNVVSKVTTNNKASLQQQYSEHCAVETGELTNLNTAPQISQDVQHLMIDKSTFNCAYPDAYPESNGLLDMFNGGNSTIKQNRTPGYTKTVLESYMPQAVSCSDRNNGRFESPSIKEEPLDLADYRRYCHQYLPSISCYSGENDLPVTIDGPTITTLTPSTVTPAGVHPFHQQQHRWTTNSVIAHEYDAAAAPTALPRPRKRNKSYDKASEQYRRRRERNNIAVKKSRDKAKLRYRETEEQLQLLVTEKEIMKKEIEFLTGKLIALKSIFSSSVDVIPEQLHREISKHLD